MTKIDWFLERFNVKVQAGGQAKYQYVRKVIKKWMIPFGTPIKRF